MFEVLKDTANIYTEGTDKNMNMRDWPYPALWAMAKFSDNARMFKEKWGIKMKYDPKKAEELLGLKSTPAIATIIKSGEYYAKAGMIPNTKPRHSAKL